MKCIVFFLTLAELFLQSQGYTQCSYTYYYYGTRRTTYYRCSSNQYCCGSGSCCTMVYARWYLWFVLVSIFLIFFLIWWYYRYRYRPRQGVVTSGPVPVVSTATSVVSYPNTSGGYPQPAAYPAGGYPGGYQGQPVYMYPAAGTAQYNPHGPQKGPPQAPSQAFAPPPSYESAMGPPGVGPAYPPPPPNNPR